MMKRPCPSRGFTLLEIILVIAITGIIGAVVAVFLKAPVDQYIDIGLRAGLTDTADTALRRIGRDIRHSLPNSVRVTGGCTGSDACTLEFIPTIGGGRYRVGRTPAGVGDPLEFDAVDTNFDVLGHMPTMATNDHVVVYSLGITGANPYAFVGDTEGTHVRRRIAAVDAVNQTVTIESTEAMPFDSPGHRFHVVQTPARYVCDPAAGTLTRQSGYGWPEATTAPTTSALLARGVSRCLFRYDGALTVTQRTGLVTMSLSLTETSRGSSETVALHHQVHVSNMP